MHRTPAKVARLSELETRAGRVGKGREVKAIVALDLGSKTGFAVRNAAGFLHSGTFDARGKPKDPPGVRWSNFRRFLVDLKQANPDLVEIHYEQVHRHIGTDAAHVYGALQALVELFAFNHQIALKPIGVGTWKKRFTGNGAAKKDEVIAVCRQIGLKPASTDEADALAILHVALNQCPVLTPSPAPKKAPRTKQPALMPQDGAPF